MENNRKRKYFFPVRGKAIRLPVFFPSISSVKTGLNPFEYFKILKTLNHPHFLVSAFDIDKSFQRKEFIKELQINKNSNGPIILMDSGNYESYWTRNNSWNINSFNQILEHNLCDLAFCYDNQIPPKNPKDNASQIAKSTKLSQKVTKTASIVPIIHCKKEHLIETVLELYNHIYFSMLSIPERILGDGLLERINTVTKLRKELNKLDNYIYVHLLGTGNPFSLLLFSLSGADSFDGLEWCQTVVNSKTAMLYHFQQRELIIDGCNFCNSDFDYTLSTLGHNLTFYNSWMNIIRNSIYTNKSKDLLLKYFDSNFISKLNKIWA